MGLPDTIVEWAQLALNAGALATGGVVWKLYFENLRATIGTKQAEVDLAKEQASFWRDKATELDKRTPEAVERVLAERIGIREAEIGRLTDDRELSDQDRTRLQREVSLLKRTLGQTKGFLEVLAMEQPDPDDPEYEEYLEYLRNRDDQAVEIEVVYMGNVGVDSGQLLITDPCYIDSEWQHEPFRSDRVYKDSESGSIVRWGEDFLRFDEPLAPYGQSPESLIKLGRLVQLPPPPLPEKFNYSYNGSCQATAAEGYGELVYAAGHAGAGVVFNSGWGDGIYPVFAEKHDGRIMRVYINTGAEPDAQFDKDGATDPVDVGSPGSVRSPSAIGPVAS
jgi:hypothetical protein